MYADQDIINLFLVLGSGPVLTLSQWVLQVNPCSRSKTQKGEWLVWKKFKTVCMWSKDTFFCFPFCRNRNECPFFLSFRIPVAPKQSLRKACFLFVQHDLKVVKTACHWHDPHPLCSPSVRLLVWVVSLVSAGPACQQSFSGTESLFRRNVLYSSRSVWAFWHALKRRFRECLTSFHLFRTELLNVNFSLPNAMIYKLKNKQRKKEKCFYQRSSTKSFTLLHKPVLPADLVSHIHS